MAYLYRHIRLDKNEPFYIGIGSDDNYKRAFNKTSRTKHWKNIVNSTEYEVEIMIDDLTWEQACKKEKEFIALYGRKDKDCGTLCNYTDGGEGVLGLIVSKESREKMRIAQIGKKQPPEQIAKRVAKLTGPGNPWFGKKFSKEYRQKLSLAKKGKKRDPELMKKIHDNLKKKVIHVNSGIVFNSIKDAAEYVNKSASTMSRWLNKPNSGFKIL